MEVTAPPVCWGAYHRIWHIAGYFPRRKGKQHFVYVIVIILCVNLASLDPWSNTIQDVPMKVFFVNEINS